jgi:hypothetical protein
MIAESYDMIIEIRSPDGRKAREEVISVPRDTLALMGGPVANLLAVLENTLQEGEV